MGNITLCVKEDDSQFDKNIDNSKIQKQCNDANQYYNQDYLAFSNIKISQSFIKQYAQLQNSILTQPEQNSQTLNESEDNNNSFSVNESQESRIQNDSIFHSFTSQNDTDIQFGNGDLLCKDISTIKNQNLCQSLDYEKKQQVKKLLQESDDDQSKQWSLAYQKQNIAIHKKMSPDIEEGIVFIKAKMLIKNRLIEDVFNQFYLEKNRAKWDKILKNVKVFQNFDENSDVIYYVVDGGFSVKNRDFVLKRVVEKEFNNENKLQQIQITNYSIETDLVPENSKNIRASCIVQGYILKQIDNDVELNLVSGIDIKGQVPKFLVNKFADTGVRDWLLCLNKSLN